MLKYTPEHMHCLAMFYGPLAPPTTGVVAFQKLSNNQVNLIFALILSYVKHYIVCFFSFCFLLWDSIILLKYFKAIILRNITAFNDNT